MPADADAEPRPLLLRMPGGAEGGRTGVDAEAVVVASETAAWWAACAGLPGGEAEGRMKRRLKPEPPAERLRVKGAVCRGRRR
jgi:hypothetical protein